MEPLLHQIFVSIHILGAVLGAGAAFVSDVAFLKSIKNKNIDKIELSFLVLLSRIVWVGLLIMIISGVGLFALNPDALIQSSKFLAKMSIVGIIILNGVIFHFLHIPFIKKNTKVRLFFNLPKGEGVILLLSGVLSGVSWFSALMLGSLRYITLSFSQIMMIYTLLLLFGVIGTAVVMRNVLNSVDSKILKKVSFLSIAFLVLFGTVLASTFQTNEYTLDTGTSNHTEKKASSETDSSNIFSAEEVAQHNTQEDCWVIVDSFVFDVTPNVRMHPSMFRCGIDVSENYHKNHGPKIRPQMKAFEVGTLKGTSEAAHSTDIEKVNTDIEPKTILYVEAGSWNVLDIMVVVERDREAVLYIDSSTHTPIGRVENIGYQPHTNVFSPDGMHSYLISRDGWITKTNLQTLEIEAFLRVGINSRGTALTDDGKYLVIGNYEPGSIVILEAESMEVLKEIPLMGTLNGEVIESRAGALVEYGSKVIIALKDMNSVWVLDTANDDLKITHKHDNIGGVESVLHDGYLTPDGKFFIVSAQDANVAWVMNTETMEEVARVKTGKTPHTGPGATWGNRTFVPALGEGLITAIDTDTWEPLAYIETGGPGLFVRHSPDPEYPYIWADTAFGDFEDEIYIIDARSLEIVKTIVSMEGKRSIHPEFTRDGKYVYVLVWGGDKIFVYDAETFEEVTTIDAVTPSLISNVGARLHEPGI